MKELITLILENIVDEPELIKIEETSANGIKEVVLTVPEMYMGKIIGKNGRIAKTIRLLANAKRDKDVRKVYVNIVSDNE